ncbi:hypothetical protein [Trueperella sp. LYQ141]|uniref:hypothetical protein n=1 Tax=Trueperella sp. LYQ141 TaxID=3391058 RepID=UPI00398360EB
MSIVLLAGCGFSEDTVKKLSTGKVVGGWVVDHDVEDGKTHAADFYQNMDFFGYADFREDGTGFFIELDHGDLDVEDFSWKESVDGITVWEKRDDEMTFRFQDGLLSATSSNSQGTVEVWLKRADADSALTDSLLGTWEVEQEAERESERVYDPIESDYTTLEFHKDGKGIASNSAGSKDFVWEATDGVAIIDFYNPKENDQPKSTSGANSGLEHVEEMVQAAYVTGDKIIVAQDSGRSLQYSKK